MTVEGHGDCPHEQPAGRFDLQTVCLDVDDPGLMQFRQGRACCIEDRSACLTISIVESLPVDGEGAHQVLDDASSDVIVRIEFHPRTVGRRCCDSASSQPESVLSFCA